MDDGYYDMYKVMKALVEVDFDGIVIPDHIPGVGSVPGASPAERRSAGGGQPRYRPNPGLAYSMAYLNALFKTARSDKA